MQPPSGGADGDDSGGWLDRGGREVARWIARLCFLHPLADAMPWPGCTLTSPPSLLTPKVFLSSHPAPSSGIHQALHVSLHRALAGRSCPRRTSSRGRGACPANWARLKFVRVLLTLWFYLHKRWPTPLCKQLLLSSLEANHCLTTDMQRHFYGCAFPLNVESYSTCSGHFWWTSMRRQVFLTSMFPIMCI